MNIRIVKRPAGEAPEHVRDAWIGLTLPVVSDYSRIVEARAQGVLSAPRGRLASWFKTYLGSGRRMRGYVVDTVGAVNLLKKADPLAAAWWLANTPHLLKPELYFVF